MKLNAFQLPLAGVISDVAKLRIVFQIPFCFGWIFRFCVYFYCKRLISIYEKARQDYTLARLHCSCSVGITLPKGCCCCYPMDCFRRKSRHCCQWRNCCPWLHPMDLFHTTEFSLYPLYWRKQCRERELRTVSFLLFPYLCCFYLSNHSFPVYLTTTFVPLTRYTPCGTLIRSVSPAVMSSLATSWPATVNTRTIASASLLTVRQPWPPTI